MIIAIASGKGGTGKTTLSVALAEAINNCILIDCDVEEPNAAHFLHKSTFSEEPVYIPYPFINEYKCIACGKCSEICRYNAIVTLKNKAMLFKEMCHCCGGCKIICPEGAIEEKPEQIGVIRSAQYNNTKFYEGRINVGSVLSPYLIGQVKKKIDPNIISILDCPPGTTCPVVAALDDSDYIILVTEPTPFGLNDLTLAIDLVKQLNIPFSVFINKYEQHNTLIDDYCKRNDIHVIGRLNDSMKIAKAYSEGVSIIQYCSSIKETMLSILSAIAEKLI